MYNMVIGGVNMYKRLLSIILGIMCLSLTSCGTIESTEESTETTQTEETTQATTVLETTTETTTESTTEAITEATTTEEVTTYEPNTLDDIQQVEQLDPNVKYDMLNFSIELFKRRFIEDNSMGENTLVSPQSLYYVLAMVVNGSDGVTKQELADTLFPDSDLDTFNSSITYLLNSTDPNVCKNANAIWLRDDFSINESFADYCTQYFNAKVESKAFDMDFVDYANNWAYENTDGMIDTILNEVPSEEAIMYLANAISFDDVWLESYDDMNVREGESFYSSQDETESVTMLHSQEYYYFDDGRSSGFLKYYTDERYAFLAIVPDMYISLPNYIQNLTVDSFNNIFTSMDFYTQNVNFELYVTMPEYKYDCDYDFSKDLIDMGIETAFNDMMADFPNMVNGEELYISKVLQKSAVQVDRNGTKASASTVAEMSPVTNDGDKPHYSVDLNQPFMYAIMDMDTQLPVFMGVVNTIETSESED